MSGAADFIRHPLLEQHGVEHGFGTRTSRAPEGLLKPKQVHGTAVAVASEAGGLSLAEADAVISCGPGRMIGVVTADCVPILLSTERGEAVAAIHAGWRGLAAGVVARGVAALRSLAGDQRFVAAIGPHIGPCCYEVDAPVTTSLEERFAVALAGALTPTRPGHHRLALARLVEHDLVACGVPRETIGAVPDACTACDPARFHSFRRDGKGAGRLVHYVTVGAGKRIRGSG
jgi:YfiH family protein